MGNQHHAQIRTARLGTRIEESHSKELFVNALGSMAIQAGATVLPMHML